MTYTYIQAIGIGFPGVECHAPGVGAVYEDIIWDGGSPMPSKDALDTWIAANQQTASVPLTKYEFRKLFTFNERVAIDNAPTNTTISAQYRAAIVTMLKDLEVSGSVFLTNPDVISGLNSLEELGLLGPGRAVQILANTPPV